VVRPVVELVAVQLVQVEGQERVLVQVVEQERAGSLQVLEVSQLVREE
jgi:hypothetical protein